LKINDSARDEILIGIGGSVLQSPLIMPMLQMPQVPVKYAGQQTAYLLHNRYVMSPPHLINDMRDNTQKEES
jgi:hypothetical protein